MNRKEEIIFATLELASQKGLSNISMQQIADKVGIKKPSLYNHFKSKEEIIDTMYHYLRNKTKEKNSIITFDYGMFVQDKSAEEVLTQSVTNYINMNQDKKMFMFYKIIYSERAINPTAAKILTEETNCMISATKNLFYALQVHKKIFFDNVDMAAISFAMSVHAIIDYQLDCDNAGESSSKDMLKNYVKWFYSQFGGTNNEKNIN